MFPVHSLNGALGSPLSISPIATRAFRYECLRLCWGWPSRLGCCCCTQQVLTSFLVFCFGSIFRTCSSQLSCLSLMNSVIFLMLLKESRSFLFVILFSSTSNIVIFFMIFRIALWWNYWSLRSLSAVRVQGSAPQRASQRASQRAVFRGIWR